MTASTRRELRSAATSTSTTAIDLIRPLTDARPIKPTSARCLSARRPNPGRGSTYRRGNSVQTAAATSLYDDRHAAGLDLMRRIYEHFLKEGMSRPAFPIYAYTSKGPFLLAQKDWRN